MKTDYFQWKKDLKSKLEQELEPGLEPEIEPELKPKYRIFSLKSCEKFLNKIVSEEKI